MEFRPPSSKPFTEGYGFFFLVAGLMTAAVWSLVSIEPPTWRSGLLAFLCALSVAMAEIVSRYRDEPLRAVSSPFGLLYLAFNGLLGFGLLAAMLKYRKQFGLPDGLDSFWAALLAGFGSTAIMRTRLAVIRGSDNKDISIGPDIVVKTLLQMVDQYIDRTRAAARLEKVVRHIEAIAGLGDDGKGGDNFAQAANYLLASLLAFQNLDEERKKQLQQLVAEYAQSPAPNSIKYFAVGFVFLTLAGERQFEAVVLNAVHIKKTGQP